MMFDRIRRHPIAMTARFDHVLSLTYAAPAESVARLLPSAMHVDAVGGLGFMTVAIVRVRAMRPVGLPAWAGGDYVLSGCRAFVRVRDASGRTRRGLRIIQSDTDRRSMVWGGNLLTHYNYALARVRFVEGPGFLNVGIDAGAGRGALRVIADLDEHADDVLPPGSPFSTQGQARRFAGPLPYTFDYEPRTGSVVMIEGVRDRWEPRLVRAQVRWNTFLRSGVLGDALAEVEPVFAGAFHVGGVDYRWERGRLIRPVEVVS